MAITAAAAPLQPEIVAKIRNYLPATFHVMPARASTRRIYPLISDASNTYELPTDAYYNSCQVTYLNLGMDFLDETFTESLAKGMRAIIDGEGPYLIHCNEGKDRAGFVSALLECLMGASADEVADDYMETYENYYGVEKGTEKYNAVLNNNLVKSLNAVFGVDDIYTADLAAEAEAYMTENLGLSADEVAALKAKLGA